MNDEFYKFALNRIETIPIGELREIMTTNTPRTDTAPDLLPCSKCKGEGWVRDMHDIEHGLIPCEKCKGSGKSDQSSPFTGGEPTIKESSIVARGEPTTDSVGREAEQRLAAAQDEYDFCVRSNERFSIPARLAYAYRELQAARKALAAREPAPVARELDVEAEHLAAIEEAARTLESAAAHNRSKGRTVFAHAQQGRADRLRIALKHFGSQSTAESAPASAAPLDAVVAAARKLVKAKGRYHTELNYKALAAALDDLAAPSNSSPVGAKESK